MRANVEYNVTINRLNAGDGGCVGAVATIYLSLATTLAPVYRRGPYSTYTGPFSLALLLRLRIVCIGCFAVLQTAPGMF